MRNTSRSCGNRSRRILLLCSDSAHYDSASATPNRDAEARSTHVCGKLIPRSRCSEELPALHALERESPDMTLSGAAVDTTAYGQSEAQLISPLYSGASPAALTERKKALSIERLNNLVSGRVEIFEELLEGRTATSRIRSAFIQ